MGTHVADYNIGCNEAPGLSEEQGVEHAGQAAYGAGDQVQRVDSAGVVNPGGWDIVMRQW